MVASQITCFGGVKKSPISVTDEMKIEAMQIVKTMPLKQRITQLIMPAVKMFDMDSARFQIDKFVGENQVGGLMFYKGECSQQIELYNRAVSKSKMPLLIAIDGEWGLEMRLRKAPRFPINMALGAVNDAKLLEEYGEETGRQCKRMGINIDFSPVIDVNSNPQNPVIGRRAYSDNKEIVAKCGVAYALGMEKAGVLSCAKHFPGHGDTNQDSHKTLPTVNRTKEEIYDVELYTFRKYIAAGLNGMMVAHLNVPALDNISGLCSSISPVIVDGLLRKKMSFDGLVFTDALNMKGVTKYQDVAVHALLAGNDILVMPENFDKCVNDILAAIESGRISESMINERCAKVLAYKKAMGINLQTVKSENILEDLRTKECSELMRKLARKSITLVRDNQGISQKAKGKSTQLISLGEDENLKLISLGDSVVTDRDFYRYLDNGFKHVFAYNSKTPKMPNYDGSKPIVVEVFSAKQRYIDALSEISKHNNVVIIFYLTPYDMLKFKDAVTLDNAIICAYEDTYEAQMAAQELVQGKGSFEGIMPVKIDF